MGADDSGPSIAAIGYIAGNPTMELVRDPAAHPHLVASYAAGEVRLGAGVFRRSLIVAREALVTDWNPPPPGALAIADFAAALALAPDVVILGTGARQQLPPPALYAALAGRGVGLEVMDNGAACRTYNVLFGEYRAVVLALIL
ncbi:MAG: hypothetical protein EPO25_12335 [Gammaproteobacteria bacterium]|nr:MAG: hypothetical protein EPO25_12335 [Gammaproteobacteria bacterium]